MLNNGDNCAIRTTALLEAVRFCGNEKNLASALNIQQPAISKWINNYSIKIPYDLALRIEQITGINIERLAPDQKKINDYLKQRNFSELILRKIDKNQIITNDSVSLPFAETNTFIIIGSDLVLIYGIAILNSNAENTIKALVLDLISLISGTSSILGTLHKLLITERIAIGLRIEQLIGKRNGRKSIKKNIINLKNSSVCDQLIGRTDAHIAKIIGFSKDTYIRGKQIYLSGNQKLINAVNNKTMTIFKAAKLIDLAKKKLTIKQ